MFIRKHILFPSMLVFASVNATETADSSLLYEGIKLAASDTSLGSVKQKAIGVAQSYAEDKTKSALLPYLNTLDVSINAGQNVTSPEYEIMGLKAYDNDGLKNSFFI